MSRFTLNRVYFLFKFTLHKEIKLRIVLHCDLIFQIIYRFIIIIAADIEVIEIKKKCKNAENLRGTYLITMKVNNLSFSLSKMQNFDFAG